MRTIEEMNMQLTAVCIDTDSDPLEPTPAEAIRIAAQEIKSEYLKSPQAGAIARRGTEEKQEVDDWELVDFVDLRSGDYPDRGEEIIEGFIRDGEVGFVGSVSKAAKSWLIAFLIWCVVSGRPWFGKQVKQGKVLLIDNELKRRELDWRHTQISRAMQFMPDRDQLKVVCRRGKNSDIDLLAAKIRDMDLTGYSMIVIDAIYKTIPDGKSENDNEAMGKLMNTLQRIAESTGVAVMCVHHGTKGEQSHKSTLDVLAGAGSFGRSLDSMVALREHEQEGVNVLEFKTRTNPEPEAISVKFEWPLWECLTLEPALRKPKSGNEARQKADDQEADALIMEALESDKLTATQFRSRTGMGQSRIDRCLARLEKAGRVRCKRLKKKGGSKVIERWECTEKCTAERSNIGQPWEA